MKKDLTVSELRTSLAVRIKSMRQEISLLERKLALLDDLLKSEDATVGGGGGIKSNRAKKPNTPESAVDTTLGREITDFIRNSEGDFRITDIANKLLPQFPEESLKSISRRASAIAFRLSRRGEIITVTKGSGSEPSVYRRA